MKSIKVIIIDDEMPAIKAIQSLLGRFFPDISLVYNATSVQDGFQLIRKIQPDIVLLDIKMRDGTGFDLLNKFDKIDFSIIFITAFDDFALKAFQYNAFNYLLKPLDIDDFVKVFDKCLQQTIALIKPNLPVLMESIQQKKLKKIAFQLADEIIYANLDDINLIRADINYSVVHFANQETILTSKSLKEYAKILLPPYFFRPHQSYLINMLHVKKYVKNDGGYILMANDIRVAISRRNKVAFLELLNKH